MSDAAKVRVEGVGFMGALTLLFIGLRLTDQIDWAWQWVLAPLWAPFAIALGVVGVFAVVAMLVGAIVGVAVLVVWGFEEAWRRCQ